MKLPRKSRDKDAPESGEPKTENAKSEQPAQATPLDLYMQQLRAKLQNYSISTIDLSGPPLAEEQPRTWFLGSRDPGFCSQTWHEKVLSMSGEMQRMEIHGLHSIFQKHGNGDAVAKKKKNNEVPPWTDDAAYSSAYARAVDKALPRLPPDWKPPPLPTRPSMTWQWLRNESAWLRSQVDVYQDIVAHASSGVTEAMCVADVSQSTNRGSISTSGRWGTLCTSTKLVCFQGKGSDGGDLGGTMLSGQGNLELLGFNTSKLQLAGLSDSDLRDIAGNAMSFTQYAAIILPLAKHLGCL